MSKETKITVMAEFPDEWISAEKAREAATSIRNQSVTTLVDNIMEIIKRESNAGALSTTIRIKGGKYTSVYQTAQEILKKLGYTVDGESSGVCYDRDWTIKW